MQTQWECAQFVCILRYQEWSETSEITREAIEIIFCFRVFVHYAVEYEIPLKIKGMEWIPYKKTPCVRRSTTKVCEKCVLHMFPVALRIRSTAVHY